jgi:hypothetical protein
MKTFLRSGGTWMVLYFLSIFSGWADEAESHDGRGIVDHATVVFEHAFLRDGKKVNFKVIILSTHMETKLVIFESSPKEDKKAGHTKTDKPVNWIWSSYNGSVLLRNGQTHIEATNFEFSQNEFPQIDTADKLVFQLESVLNITPSAQDLAALKFIGSLGMAVAHSPLRALGSEQQKLIAGMAKMKVDCIKTDLTNYPFVGGYATEHPRPERSPFTIHPPTSDFEPHPDPSLDTNAYNTAAKWLLAYYAANNGTPSAVAGKELMGITFLRTVPHPTQGYVQYYMAYIGDEKAKDATVTHSYTALNLQDVLNPELDTATAWSYLGGLFVGEDGSPSGPNAPGATGHAAYFHIVQPAPQAQVLTLDATKDATHEISEFEYDKFLAAINSVQPTGPWWHSPSVAIPNFVQDSNGLSASTSAKLKPQDPYANSAVPAVTLSGGKYFENDLYNAGANLAWSPTNDITLGPDFSRKVSAMGDSVKKSTSGLATMSYKLVDPDAEAGSSDGKDMSLAAYSLFTPVPTQGTPADKNTKDSDPNDLACTLNLSGGINAVSNNANGPTATNTDEYTGIAHGSQILREYARSFLCSKEEKERRNLAAMVISFDEWIKSAEATQKSNFYTGSIGRCDFQADIPTDWPTGWRYDDVGANDDLTHAPECFRVEATLTGGGLAGVAPGGDEFSGGNTDSAGSSGASLPDPVLRSFGTGKLQLYPITPKKGVSPSGATSYANANLTVAFPFPYLTFPLLDHTETAILNRVLDGDPDGTHPIVDDSANENTIGYWGNYADRFSFRPVFTSDAVWLGAPYGFRDRNLISVGGGGEFSILSINIDLLYEVTLHDTAVKQQPLGENVIAQVSYDIHF